jgi:hypothetical protein
VSGRDAFLNLAIGAQDEAEANLYATMSSCCVAIETVSPLTAPTPLNRATAALTKTGRSDRAAGRPHHLDATG